MTMTRDSTSLSHPHRIGRSSLALVAFGLAFGLGCAAFPTPTETVADAMASVRGAEELGAEQVPTAALKLQLAREQVADAKALMEDGKNERAFYAAKRASEDAELAIAFVRETRASESSSEAKARVQATEKTQ